jgi:Trp operon repressor
MPVVRAPQYDEPKVETSGLPAPRLSNPGPTGTEAIAGALNEAGHAAVQLTAREFEKGQKEASLVQRTQASAAAQDFVTKRFYSKDGLFSKQSATELLDDEEKAFGDFDRTVTSLREGFRSPEDQQAFLADMSGLRSSLRRQVETHVAQRFETEKVDSARARVEKGLTNIQAGMWADPAEVAKEIGRMQESAPLLAPSAEGQEVARNDIATKAWLTVIEQHLSQQDAVGARDVIKAHGVELAAHRAALEKRIQAIENATTAETAASTIAKAASDARGWMNEKKAEELLGKVPPGPLRDEVEQRLDHKKTIAREIKKGDIDTAVNAALSSYTRGGNTLSAIRPDLKQWLQDNAADEWLKIVRADRAEHRSARAAQTEERRLQAQLNAEALSDFKAKETADQLKVGNIDTEYPDADLTTRNKIREEQKKARASQGKAEAIFGDEFKSAARAEALKAGIKGKKEQDRFISGLDSWRTNWSDTHGGKPPSREDFLKEVADRLLYDDGGYFGRGRFKYEFRDDEEFTPSDEQPYKPEPGVAGSSSAPAAEAPQQAPAAARPSKKDRAVQLKNEGKSVAEITATLNAEGY